MQIPLGQFLNGVNNGLYLTLDSEAFESSYDDEFSLSTGFLMTLSYPFTRPIVKQKGLKLFTELSFPKFDSFIHTSNTEHQKLNKFSYINWAGVSTIFIFSGVFLSPGSEYLFPFR